jgi:hypothetical protein
MPDRQNPRLCLDLAEQARMKADVQSDVDLYQSYIELAEDYEILAQVLERIQRKRALLDPT